MSTTHPSRSAPRCSECKHAKDPTGRGGRLLRCNHPAQPVDPVDHRPIAWCGDARANGTDCGPFAALFEARQAATVSAWPSLTTAATPPAAAPRFKVCALTAAGQRTEYDAIGGSSCGHAADALDAAGLGGSVNVKPLRSADLAGEVRPC